MRIYLMQLSWGALVMTRAASESEAFANVKAQYPITNGIKLISSAEAPAE